jgi:hypothetical protein
MDIMNLRLCHLGCQMPKYLDKFVIVFLDDIIIYLRTKKEHEKHLRMVLQVLSENKLYSKHEYFDKFVIVFLDDMIIYLRTEKEHEKRLRMVLQVLRENKLYSNLSKCIFYQKKIHHLGHIISMDGIEVISFISIVSY